MRERREYIDGRKVMMVAAIGRPPKFETVEDLQAAIDAYFDGCYEDRPRHVKVGKEYHILYDSDGKPVTERVLAVPYTVTGLALALGTTRETLMDIEHGNGPYADPRFSDAIKRAKLRVEHGYELGLHGTTPAGAIFGLKNFGWRDQQDVNLQASGDMTIQVSFADQDQDEDD
jgi:hypothetical protein